jgi:hypothetical protein
MSAMTQSSEIAPDYDPIRKKADIGSNFLEQQ